MGRNAKTNSGTEFLKGIGIIIVGIFMIFGTADAVANSFKEPPSLYDLRTEELQVGEYVQEDLYAALDYFMYEETTRTKYGIEVSSRVSAYYYIIPVLSENKEELYMAVEVPASAEPEMYSICEDTLSLLSGNMKPTQFGHNTYHVRGKLRNMKEEELQYMTEWFQETVFFGTTNAAEIRNHIYPVMLQEDDTILSRILMITGFVFIIIGISMVKGNSGVRRKKNEEIHYESYSQQNTFQPYEPFQHDNPKPAINSYSSGNMQEYDSMYVPPNEKPANNLNQTENTQPPANTFPPRSSQPQTNAFPPRSSQPQNGIYQPFNSQPQEGQYQSKIMQMHAAMYQSGNSAQSDNQNPTTNAQPQSTAFYPSNAFPPRTAQPQNTGNQAASVPPQNNYSDTYTSDSGTEQKSSSYPSPNLSFYDPSYDDN